MARARASLREGELANGLKSTQTRMHSKFTLRSRVQRRMRIFLPLPQCTRVRPLPFPFQVCRAASPGCRNRRLPPVAQLMLPPRGWPKASASARAAPCLLGQRRPRS